MLDGVVLYGVLLVSLVVHEAAHALTALWGGDKTAYLGGQVTLNPMPHMKREPFGTVLLPIGLLVFSGGAWCMGYAHTPIDPVWAYRNPRKAALMSAAGPVSNFLLALIAAIVLKVLVAQGLLELRYATKVTALFMPTDGSIDGALYATGMICTVFLLLNILLGILNLIPFPPLDGAGILGGFFPKTMGRLYDFVRTQPMFMLLGIIAIFYGIQELVWPVFDVVIRFIGDKM